MAEKAELFQTEKITSAQAVGSVEAYLLSTIFKCDLALENKVRFGRIFSRAVM